MNDDLEDRLAAACGPITLRVQGRLMTAREYVKPIVEDLLERLEKFEAASSALAVGAERPTRAGPA